jgi:hypothetical protein
MYQLVNVDGKKQIGCEARVAVQPGIRLMVRANRLCIRKKANLAVAFF